jgi:hypothetical protein
MALADSGRAIGAVTRLLHDRLLSALTRLEAPDVPIDDVTVGRPEPPQGTDPRRRLNLFLYEVELDGHLRNVPLDAGQPAPLWLALRYLLTAFDHDGESDTIEAHEILGEAVRVLQDLNFFSLDDLPTPAVAALADNPDQLKLTFEEASSDLLAKLMQGSDERYRCSMAFQVRPVMVALGEPPAYAFLVGVDSRAPAVIGEDGVRIPVLPSLGPAVERLTPDTFETGDSVTVTGTDLHLSGLSVLLGPVELGVTSQQPDRLTFRVGPALADGTRISAGSHVVVVTQALPGGRRRKSNVLVGGLRPRLDSAVPSNLVRVQPAIPNSPVRGRITLTGVLLGTADDEVYVALYRAGRVVRMYDELTRPPAVPPQTELRLEITDATAVPPGEYHLILRVNGRQARNSPLVRMVAP